MPEGGGDTAVQTAAQSQEQSQKGAASQAHQRTYQACIPCRSRKVRCDLGPVDNPREPPCVRCRRESKECYFSATRRKRKTGDEEDIEEYEARNRRKRTQSIPAPASSSPQNPQPSFRDVGDRPRTPGGSVGRTQPLRRPGQGPDEPKVEMEEDEGEEQRPNNAIPIMQGGEIFSGHDALNLLVEAVNQNGDGEHHRTTSMTSSRRPFTSNGMSPSTAPSYGSPTVNGSHFQPGSQHPPTPRRTNSNMSQAMANMEARNNEAKYQTAIQAWSRLRFVRAGLFTAKEGIAYIDYFYAHMSPLTPIIVPDYQDHATHPTLLKEEPMLLVTLLTITSRYMNLDGPGAQSRPYHIHFKLWEYLQGMITRLVWGQEQFGGGFCGAGGQPSSEINPLTRKGLRSLGTVESLMLLTEWHPRGLHFPPSNDDDELLLPDGLLDSSNVQDFGQGGPADTLKGVGGQRIDSWLEPCWRSDRVCWMQLGIAMSVAFEIGIFSEASDADVLKENLPREYSDKEVATYLRRKNHLKQLLIVYATQTSGRLGLTSMLPKIQNNQSFLKAPGLNQLADFATAQLRSPGGPNFSQMELMPASPAYTGATQRENVQDLVVSYWTDIARLFEAGNLQLFPSRKQTRELISSNRYRQLLDFFAPIHEGWRQTLENNTNIPVLMKHVITIEIEYSRVYVNSLALQAVMDRCAHNSPRHNRSQAADGGAIPFATLKEWTGSDRKYIDQVVDAARHVLRIVVDGLLPGDVLKHAPVRTFFRVVSTAIILLKTFALGATEHDVEISLHLMDLVSNALRTSIVDDVHVGNRFSDLLSTLTNRIRAGFVRMSQPGNTDISRGATRSPTLRMNDLMPPPQVRQNKQSTFEWSAYLNSGTTTPVLGTQSPALSARAAPSHPLFGITTETYDPGSSNAATIVPPPSFGFNGGYDATGQFGFDANSGYDMNANGGDMYGAGSDWLTLPIDNIVNSSQNYGDITQTPYGPELGGFDMLDVLLASNGTDFGTG